MQPFLMILLPENKIQQGPMEKEAPFPVFPLNSYTQTNWVSAEAPLLLMGTLVEDEGDGSGGRIPGSLKYLIPEPPLISTMVPLSQV